MFCENELCENMQEIGSDSDYEYSDLDEDKGLCESCRDERTVEKFEDMTEWLKEDTKSFIEFETLIDPEGKRPDLLLLEYINTPREILLMKISLKRELYINKRMFMDDKSKFEAFYKGDRYYGLAMRDRLTDRDYPCALTSKIFNKRILGQTVLIFIDKDVRNRFHLELK